MYAPETSGESVPSSPDAKCCRHGSLSRSSLDGSDVSDQDEVDMVGVALDPNSRPLAEWVSGLVGATYFEPCKRHLHLKRNECTFYCATCARTEAMCHQCLPSHEQHRILQLRRYVYEDVVNTSEMSAFMNVDGIQTYTINAAPVIFVKDRPKNNPARNSNKNSCRMCSRSLKDGFEFCSVACKVKAAREWDQSDLLVTKQPPKPWALKHFTILQKRPTVRCESDHSNSTKRHCSPCLHSSRRKQSVPRRSPSI